MADLNNKLINFNDLSHYDEKIKGYIEDQSSTANNGTLTIQKNGSNVATFTANQATNTTANIVVPTKPSDIGALAANGSNANTTQFQIGSDKIYLGNIDSDSNNGEILEANVSLFKYNDSEVATHNWVESNEVFEKGSASNSGVLKGSYDRHSNKALSQVSLAIGAASTAGLKGWHYNKINFNTKQIFLTASQPRTVSITTATSDNNSFTSGYAVGDIISIVNDSKYEYCSKITAVKGNVLTLDSLPFTASDWHTGSMLITPDPDEFSIYCIKYSYSNLTKTLTISKHDVGGVDFGGGALAEGIHTYALNLGAHAEGIQTVVFGQYGHAEGFRTQAAYASHAEGKESEARGSTSHAEGVNTRAIGNGTHTEGYRTVAKGQGAHTEGHSATLASDATIAGDSTTIINAWNTDKFTLAKGTASHAEGKDTLALGNYSHSEGQQTIAQGSHSHAEGKDTKATGQGSHAEGETTSATASRTHAEGSGTSATSNNAHAEGMSSIASGNSAHAEGVNTIAGPAEEAPAVNTNAEAGNFAHAEGNGTWAKGNSAHAEGKKTTASGPYSHAEGYSTTASGNKGHAEGHMTQATGDSAHSEGQNTIASHTGSHAGGYQTKTSKNFQTVVGQYNADNANAYLIVGRGSADGRANAFEAGYDSTNKDFIKVGTEILTASKLAAMKNPADLTFGSKKYDGQTAMTITAADLGLSGAMKFLGTSTTAISDGSTTKTITVSGSSITVSAGNVVLYGGHEYVWTGSAWEELGHEGSFKVKQSAVTSPSTSGSTTAFIDTISQDANGKITATKKNVSFPVTSVNGQTGAVKIDLSDYATEEWVEDCGFLTSISKADVTNALGYTPPTKDTTYSAATQSAQGLMSAADKKKLDGIATGANAYSHPSTHPASMITGLATVATSGSYSDLSGKPTIPDVSNYLPKSGGTMTGSIITPKDDDMGIIPSENNFGQIGSSDKKFYRMYASTFYGDISGGYYDGEESYDLIHSGNISSQTVGKATKLSTDAGSATQPVYFSGGKPVATTYTLGASVPSGAKFTDTTYSAATQSAQGLMSAADKKKLDGIDTGANAYSLPTASASTLGGIKVGTNLSISNGVLSAKDTTYSIATQSQAGLMSSTDKQKLDGIPAGGGGGSSVVFASDDAIAELQSKTPILTVTCNNTLWDYEHLGLNGHYSFDYIDREYTAEEIQATYPSFSAQQLPIYGNVGDMIELAFWDWSSDGTSGSGIWTSGERNCNVDTEYIQESDPDSYSGITIVSIRITGYGATVTVNYGE